MKIVIIKWSIVCIGILMRKSSGFTLVEILITLTLLGVIAACTLPFLLTEMNHAKWTVTYKNVFAETLNALTRVTAEEDCGKSLYCTHLFDGGQIESTKSFGNRLTKSLLLSRNCGTSSEGACFSHKVSVGLSGSKKETLKETMLDRVSFSENGPDVPFYTFVTSRGVSYAVLSFGLSCLNNSSEQVIAKDYIKAYVAQADNENNQMLNLCGFIIVDVNGAEKPNIWGRDVFGLWITDKDGVGVYPFGGEFDNAFGGQCGVTAGSDTRGCAAQLIKDGWKMTY